MIKCASFLLTGMLVVSLAACGSPSDGVESRNESLTASSASSVQVKSVFSGAAQKQPVIGEESMAAPSATPSKVLVAYFSRADNIVPAADVDTIASASVASPGSVAQLAGWIQGKTGGDLFFIRVTEPYPSDWDSCLERANQEKADDARPELMESAKNIEDYDVIFLGYPNWLYSTPMAVFSFLESHDLTGKTVYLFCSHGTGGLAGSVRDITAALPGASISDNVFDVNEADTAASQDGIVEWLRGLGFPF